METTGRVYVDYSDGVPSVDALVKAGVSGTWRYVGTPGHPKNLTQMEYSSLVSGGLDVCGVFELDTDDWRGGQAAGERNAVAARADFVRCGAPEDAVLALAVDAHLDDPADLALARAYQRGGFEVLAYSTGAYGPVEYIHAVQGDGTAATLWQWGHAPAADNPDGVRFWQRRAGEPGLLGPAARVLGGVLCDLNDELISAISATEGEPMLINGEWAAGNSQTHRLIVPVGSAGLEFGRVRFSLASGGAVSGTWSAVAKGAASKPSYPVHQQGLTLVADWRGYWDLPDGVDQVVVTFTASSAVAWALECLPR